MPFRFLLHPSRTSLNRKRHSDLRFAPRLSWLSHFSRPALSTFAPHLPRLPAFLDSPSVPFDSRPTFPTSDLHAPRLSRPSRFPLAENANRGPDCKENVPVWQKTPLGGLIRQEMRRPLDHIGKGSLLPRRKTAGQRITHCELPQDSQNPGPATRPPSGVFCQMNPASPQCPLDSPSKQSDWRAFRAVRPTSFPSDLPGEFSERPAWRVYPSRSTCFSWAPTSQKAACRRRIRQRISQWLHDACAHRSADESPSATPTTLPIFQKTSRPFSM